MAEQRWRRVVPQATKRPRTPRAPGVHRRSQSTELDTEAMQGLQPNILGAAECPKDQAEQLWDTQATGAQGTTQRGARRA